MKTLLAAIPLGAGAACAGPAVALPESFEGKAPPANWRVSQGTKPLSITDHSAKGFRHSLRWDWGGGEPLTVSANDRLSFRKARGIDLWVYSFEPVSGVLRFEIMTERGTYAFPMKLGFQGWRAVYVALGADVTASPGNGDRMVITAPDTGTGAFLFDLVQTHSKALDANRCADRHLPFIREDGEQWAGYYRFSQLERSAPPAEVTAAQRREFAEMRARYLATFARVPVPAPPSARSIPVQEFPKALRARIGRLELSGSGRRTTGKPICLARGAARGLGAVDEESFCHLMRTVADCWYRQRTEEAASAFLQMLDHMENQGYVAQSGRGNINHSTWFMRSFGSALVLARDLLAREGRLRQAFENAAWLGQLDIVFERKTRTGDVHNKVASPIELRLGALMLMPDDDPMKIVTCRAYSAWQTRALAPTEGLRGLYNPDSTSFFHGAYNVGYHVGDVARTMQWGTAFATTSHASEQFACNLKKQFQVLEFSAAKYDAALPLHNRNLFSRWNGLDILLRPLADYARVADDPAITAAALRLAPEELTRELTERGGRPGAAPTGFLPLNFGACALHRRDDWLATCKGYSRYLWAQEGGKRNTHGRYLSHGSLFIHAGGDPVSWEGSGYAPQGWDWAHIPGTTAVALPPPLLRNQDGEYHIYSEETFCGGTHMDGENGVFAVKLSANPDPSFRARKSFFFFDSRIVCLGSGITNANTHPTHTTLFQHALTGASGKQTPQWIADGQGHGYVIRPGQQVQFRRQSIVSQNAGEEQEAGKSLLAWIDHGASPQNAAYEYTVLVRGAPEVAEFATALAGPPAGRPYVVEAHTDAAHIVTDRETGLTGYALFEPGAVNVGPLASVSHPCLVMARRTRTGYRLSLCDPDLNIDTDADRARKRSVTIALRGVVAAAVEPAHQNTLWETDTPKIGTERVDDVLKVTVPCRQGRTTVLSAAYTGAKQ